MGSFIREQIRERRWKFYKTAGALAYLGAFPMLDAVILKLVVDSALSEDEDDGSGAGSYSSAQLHTCLVLAGVYIVLCPGPPGAFFRSTRPQRFPQQIAFARRACVSAQDAQQPKPAVSGPGVRDHDAPRYSVGLVG